MIPERVEALRGSIVVSVQASEGEPLCAPEHIRAMALSAINGGARGLRLEGLENITQVRRCTDLPVVGLTKSKEVPEKDRLNSVYITATLAEARDIAAAGADIIALDATARPRPDGLELQEFIVCIHNELHKPVWADVSTFEEGVAAATAGADVVSTTLSGYTAETRIPPDSAPDFELLEQLCLKLPVPVVLEGRVWRPEDVRRAFALGAFAVVVGSAITRPQLITKRFVMAIPEKQ